MKPYAIITFWILNARSVLAIAVMSLCGVTYAGGSGTLPSANKMQEEKLSGLVSARVMVGSRSGSAGYHLPPDDSQIPNDKYGDDVRLGKKIFTETYRYARRYVGNELSCSNCHLDAGRKPHAAPLWAAYGMYPAHKAKTDRNNNLDERIQQCFRFSMNGFAPTLDAPEIRALVSYAHFLSRGVPVGIEMPGRGYPQVAKTGLDPNSKRGGDAYKAKCVSCHGDNGQGQANKEGGFLFPPLWGKSSYNKGSGMANDSQLAGFIKANKSQGQDEMLTEQEALDLAAYINQQTRPGDPRKGLIKGLFE